MQKKETDNVKESSPDCISLLNTPPRQTDEWRALRCISCYRRICRFWPHGVAHLTLPHTEKNTHSLNRRPEAIQRFTKVVGQNGGKNRQPITAGALKNRNETSVYRTRCRRIIALWSERACVDLCLLFVSFVLSPPQKGRGRRADDLARICDTAERERNRVIYPKKYSLFVALPGAVYRAAKEVWIKRTRSDKMRDSAARREEQLLYCLFTCILYM